MSNCYGSFSTMRYQCTDYSDKFHENWSSGRGSQTITLPTTTKMYYEFGFTGNAWIKVNGGGFGKWIVLVKANLRPRPDNGKINSSPTVDIAPIVRLHYGCNHTIHLSVNDLDGDNIRCRWAERNRQTDECGSVCGLFPAYIHQDTCTITYQSTDRLGWYAVAIQIEDFTDKTSREPLSSVPVQFLVNVYQGNEQCNVHTEFIEPTPLDNACIGVPQEEVYKADIIARVANENRSISEIKTTSPLGMIKSPLTKITKTDWKVNVAWSPRDYNTVTNVFCFIAIETENGLQSVRRCITLLAGIDSGPMFVNGSQEPHGLMYPDNSQWSIQVDKEFVRSHRSAYINIYRDDGKLQESKPLSDPRKITLDEAKRKLTFSTTTTFLEKQDYYVLFDFGLLKGKTFCGADSPAVIDKQFWRVTIRDITAPILTFTHKPTLTNGTTSIKWRVDEPATSNCTLFNPNGTRTTVLPCNGSWSGSQDTDGFYIMNIVPTDLAGNKGSENRMYWQVDTRPPVLQMSGVPPLINNYKQVKFSWSCNEKCTVMCKVSIVGGANGSWSQCFRNYRYNILSSVSGQTFVFQIQPTDTVGNRGVVKQYKWTVDFTPPTINLCQGGASMTVSCKQSLRPNKICNVSVHDNVDQSPSLAYTDDSARQCSVTRTWTAIDVAGNKATLQQNIRLSNNIPFQVIHQPGNINIACGTQHDQSMIDVLKGMFEINHPCEIPVRFALNDDPDIEICDAIIHRTWTLTDDCGNSKTVTQLIHVLQVQEPLSPDNGQTGTDLNIDLRWMSYGENAKYSIYLWDYNSQRKTKPTSTVYTHEYQLYNLKPDTRYLWQLEISSKNSNMSISPVWGFETRKYVDLIATNIETPSEAYSGQTFQVRFTVQNVGSISTQQQYWYDAVYLSWTNSFSNAKYITRVRQRNIIGINDGYSSTASITLAKGEIGYANVFIQTNYYRYLDELNTTNNILGSLTSIHVKLTPPPDLIVATVNVPSRFYSGSTVTVRWTVLNNGEGNIIGDSWYDAIWWSTDTIIDARDNRLGLYRFYGSLKSNTNYSRSMAVTIPEFIDGNFYFLVETDIYDNIYEYKSEQNNLQSTQNPSKVILTPPPDLELTSINVKKVVKTGDVLEVTWQVTNKGAIVPYSQRYWKDSVALYTPTLELEMVVSQYHYGSLSPDESYNSTISYQIGTDLQTGLYDLYVTTNVNDRLFEYNAKKNNHLKTRITINRAVPELHITNFTVVVKSNDTHNELHAYWSVENQGTAAMSSDYWADSLYVVSEGMYSNRAVLLQHVGIYGGLRAASSYEHYEVCSFPSNIYGKVNIMLKTNDVYHTVGVKSESLTSRGLIIPLLAANLQLLPNISVTENPIGGKPLLVVYTVVNKGIAIETGSQWTDLIVLTKSRNCMFTNGELTRTLLIQNSLKGNIPYSGRTSFDLPIVMEGQYFVCIKINNRDELFEGNRNSDNFHTNAIYIQSPPTADLSVLVVDSKISESSETGRLMNVHWKVENKGNTIKKAKTGIDSIGYSRDRKLNTFVVFNSFYTEYALESSSFYEQTRDIFITSTLSGTFYVCVQVDSTSVIQEIRSQANNFACEETVTRFVKPQEAKLSVNIVNINSNSLLGIMPGSKIDITFTVENTGQMPILENSWIDSIYVADHGVNTLKDLLESGYLLTNIVHIGFLRPHQMYRTEATVTIPYGLSADVKFYVLPNNTETNTLERDDSKIDSAVNFEGNFSNIFQFSNGMANLYIVTNTSIKNLNGGEPLLIEYEVGNSGQMLTFGYWYDAVYLSTDFTLDVFDTKLKSVLRNTQLDVNETMSFNMTVILPLDMESKSYYLILSCDSRNDIAEENENDNEARIVFQLMLRTSTDLMVTQVVSQNSAEFGNNMKVEWAIGNNGSELATGYKCDTAYLSEDNKWDITDQTIGKPLCSHFSLMPFSSRSGNQTDKRTVVSKTPLVAPDMYFTIVKSRSNVIDLNLDNNINVAINKTLISVDALHLDIPASRDLSAFGILAMHIANVSLEETLLITVFTGNDYVSNSLFIKGGNAATFYDYEAVFSNTDKYINGTITSTTSEDYYILIQNTATETSSASQHIIITAKIARFEIFDIYPKTLIRASDTTIRVTGALFPNDLQVILVGLETNVTAKSVYVFSSTEAYATFFIPVTNDTVFSFKVISPSLNKTIDFHDVVRIKNGTEGYVSIYVDNPGRRRFGEIGTFSVNLINSGDSDVFVPLVFVTATGNGEFKLMTSSQYHTFGQNAFVYGSTYTGPAGILTPKSQSTLRFETRELKQSATEISEMIISVSLLKLSSEELNPLLQRKNDLKPLHYDDNEWEGIWNNFKLITGPTTKTLINKMAVVLNEMSVAGRRITDVNDMVKYLLQVADAPPGIKTLSLDSDIVLEPESQFPLAVIRLLSARRGSRTQSGPMGYGWILPLWDTKVKAVNEHKMIVTLDKRDYEFLQVDVNKHLNKEIGIISTDIGGYGLTRFNDDKVYNYNNQTFRLQSIVPFNRNERVDFEYIGDTLTKIKHSMGSYVIINYDTFDRISSMEVKNSSFAKQSSKSYYEYNFERGVLYKAVVNERTTRYAYNNDRSLKYVINQDNSLFIYEYSDMGHVTAQRYVENHQEVSGVEYSYPNEAKLVRTTTPKNVKSTITFNEHGEAILTDRKGYLPTKRVTTSTGLVTFDGDSIILQQYNYPENKHIRIKDGSGDKIDVYFDDEGQLIQFNDGGDNIYHMMYNTNGTLGCVIYPDGSNTTYSYHEFTDLITTQNGTTKRYEYDNKHQLTLKDIGNESVITFEYDDDGNLINAVNENGKLEMKYTDKMLVDMKSKTDHLKYAYNDNDFISGITGENYKVAYKYDSFGNMVKVINGRNNVTLVNAEYNSNGKITRKTFGNNAKVNYLYDDESGLLTSLTNTYPNGSVASFFKYTYSKHNRRISMETAEGIWQFKYDASGQIISMRSPDGKLTKYVYDNRKNRNIVLVDQTEMKTTVNNMNQYTRYGEIEVTYDKNGNLQQKQNGTQIETFKYDEDNRLKKFNSKGHNCSLQYDALGNLQVKECNGIKTVYVIDTLGIYGGHIIKQTVTNGGSTKVLNFYHGGDQLGLVAMDDGTDMFYFQYDPIGSVVGILNANGDLTNFYKSDPFGKVIHSSETIQTPFTYVGQWGVARLSDVSTIYWMRSRVYDAQFGRFTSIDTYGIRAKSKNFYAYCFNNPVHFSDPEGTCPLCLGAAFGALEGGFNYYMDHRGNGDYTWGGAAGAVAYGAVDGVLSSFDKYEILISAAKSGLSYAYDHRNGGYTMKGQLIAIGHGAIDELIDSKVKSIFIKSFAKGLTNMASQGLDNGFEDPIKDFVSGAESSFFGSNEMVKKACDFIEGYGPIKAPVCHPSQILNKSHFNKWEEEVKDLLQRWVRSMDPNDILGPTGKGAARFIKKDETLTYKIRFENDANATAPAQRVYVEHKFSNHLDLRSFFLGEFGFGNVWQKAPHGSSHIQTSLNVTRQHGVYVRVVAGLDIVNRLLFWEFQALDPDTGEAPISPSVGFLPPNNGTSGQGFVTFSVKPMLTVPHLAVININASIYFDENEPIDTPNIFNTIDDQSPEVMGTVVKETQSSESVTLSLNYTDSGSGVKQIDIFVRNDAGLSLFYPGVTDTMVVLKLEKGNSYIFVPVAIDNVGNVITLDLVDADLELFVEAYLEQGLCNCSGNGVCTIGANTCICNQGFYGTNCNTTQRPMEPPVLQLRSSNGYTSEPIELFMSARNMSGTLESLTLYLTGFPEGTTFSKGEIKHNNTLVVDFTEFGEINMTVTEKYTGTLRLEVDVIQVTEIQNVSRLGLMTVKIYPHNSDLQLDFIGCFSTSDNAKVAIFNATADVVNASTCVTNSFELVLPSGAYIDTNTPTADGIYTLPINVLNQVIRMRDKMEPLTVEVSWVIPYSVNCSKQYKVTKMFSISNICPKEKDDYCPSNCKCAQCHTKTCTTQGDCICSDGWTGNQCSIDSNECNVRPSVCAAHKNTDCENTYGGYSCPCLLGYALRNGACEEIPDVHTTATSNTDSANGEVNTKVEIKIDLVIPSTDNLRTEATYRRYEREAANMLTKYYETNIGIGFIKVTILSLRVGSLIIDHVVETRDNESTIQTLLGVVYNFHKANLLFDNNSVNVIEVTMENMKVDDKNSKEDMCKMFVAIKKCPLLTSCMVNDVIPACRPTSTSTDQATDDFYDNVVIPLAIGMSALGVALLIFLGIVFKNRRLNGKHHVDPHRKQYQENSIETRDL